MSKFERFREVTQEIHRLIGVEPVEPENGGSVRWVTDFEIDDVALAITYSATENPDRLCLICAFGTFGSDRQDEHLLCLLRINFTLAISGNASFCMNPSNGEVLLITSIDINEASSQSILSALLQISEQARIWRSTYFLDTAFERKDVFTLCNSSMRA